MKINDPKININGTHLQDYIYTTYDNLVNILGKPLYLNPPGEDKIQAEWKLKFDDGTIATIYDYKNYHRSVKKVTEWHIGGFSKKASKKVYELLRKK